MKTVYVCIPTTKERRPRLAECVDSILQYAGVPVVFATYENYREGFVRPIHTILDGIKEDQLVWCIGDDTRLVQPDTLKRLVEAYEAEYPENDGVVQPDDGIQRGGIITMPLCSAKTMKENTHKDFFLNFADNIFTEVMTKKGKYKYCPEIVVEHHHWVNGKVKPDETYAFAQSKFEEDRQTYFRIKKELGL